MTPCYPSTPWTLPWMSKTNSKVSVKIFSHYVSIFVHVNQLIELICANRLMRISMSHNVINSLFVFSFSSALASAFLTLSSERHVRHANLHQDPTTSSHATPNPAARSVQSVAGFLACIKASSFSVDVMCPLQEGMRSE